MLSYKYKVVTVSVIFVEKMVDACTPIRVGPGNHEAWAVQKNEAFYL
jgi:hypothetical protein